PGTSTLMPALDADLTMAWNFVDAQPNATLASFGAKPGVRLEDVRVNIGSLLADLIQPTLEDLQKALGPLQPTIHELTKPLQFLTDLGMDTPPSLLDLAIDLGEAATLLPPEVRSVVDLALDVNTLVEDSDTVLDGVSDFDVHLGAFDLS